jgi:hypothetical protein
MASNEPLNPEIARLAAAQASKLFGQWMPERWLNLFIDSYDDIQASKWDLADTIRPEPCARTGGACEYRTEPVQQVKNDK